MFYSQFILAKKGPLGTIWIAAHLERKLRKNQVADTDIGVSVDSILFPEVPIALRLSSHLLLGVVRIYSRKVNYLFHDCSEALLKIKQAFRSTAVDLPPEESTAPYHSITLPETFDLDDFELPDNAFFQGNYVDHHISTREQITLQDTMEGMVYSTSKFGLDERFGDGDASQIGLDLDEDLFLEKLSSGHASTSLVLEEDVHPETSGQPVMITEMDIDVIETSKDRAELNAGGCGDHVDSNILGSKGADDSAHLLDDHIQTPDLNEDILPFESIEGPSADSGVIDFSCNASEVPSSDLNECAQAPSTPGLMTEVAPSLNLLKRTSLYNAVEGVIGKPDSESVATDSSKPMPEENLGNPMNVPDYHIEGIKHGLDCKSLDDKNCVQSMENESLCGIAQNIQIKHPGYTPSSSGGPISSGMIQSVASPTSVLSEPKLVSQTLECSDRHVVGAEELSLECGQDRTETLENGALCNEVSSIPSIDRTHNDSVAMERQAEPLDGTIGSPVCSLEASSLQASYNKSLDGVVTIPVNYDSTINDQASSEGAPAIESVEKVSLNNNSNLEALTNVGSIGALEDSCPPGSPLPSDAEFHLGSTDKQEIENPSAHAHVLQACSSSVNQLDALPLEGGVFLENAPDLSPTEVELHAIEAQETVALHVDVAAAELQGGNWRAADVADMNLELQQMRVPLPSEIRAELNKSDECLDGVTLKDNQLGTLNCSTSSEFPAPETLLIAPTEVSDSPNGLVLQSTAGEPVTEGEGTIDRFSSLSGKKRRLMESTPVLENGNSSKFSRVLRSRRSMDYIPDDDDVLASILVGKRTPGLKMRPTPPPAELVSSKRPRVTPRVSVLKRKVLSDDHMVLHGDVIRKQLTNTEDIRRIRRKAPCTRKEISMIQKYLLEEEIFIEPLFTGMSAGLTGLQNQTYYVTETGISTSDSKQSHLEAVEDPEFSKRPELIRETGLEVVDGFITAMPGENDSAARESIETGVQIENQISEHAIGFLGFDNQEQAEAAMEIDMLDKSANDVVNHAAAVGVEMPVLSDPIPGDDCNVSADLRIESSVDKNDGTQMIPQNDDGLCLSPDQKLLIETADGQREINDETLRLTDNSFNGASIADTEDREVGTIDANNETLILDNGIERDESVLDETKGGISVDTVPSNLPQDCHNGVKDVANDEILVPLPDNSFVETGLDVLTDSLTTNIKPSVPDVDMESGLMEMAIVIDDNGTSGVSTSELGVVVEDEDVAKKVANDEGDPSTSFICTEEPQTASSCPFQLNPNMENDTSNGGEGPGCQEGHGERARETEIPVTAVSAVEDPGDFGHILDENDTDFLNADDEAELVEEDDNTMPTAEEDRFIENSGWSSRTRAVARYLRSLFDNETGRGIKMVPMDNLLAGKTRKEASRMFFETLVLKTKDYIHAEQQNPFEKINIEPRVKLMKSEL